MNYLTTEGYKEAAECFAQEAGVQAPLDLATIDARVQVRTAIQAGHIEEAIALINNLDPDVRPRTPPPSHCPGV